jgi:hypothetical protein
MSSTIDIRMNTHQIYVTSKAEHSREKEQREQERQGGRRPKLRQPSIYHGHASIDLPIRRSNALGENRRRSHISKVVRSPEAGITP